MNNMYPLFYIKNGGFNLGKRVLLEDFSIYIYPKDKLSLVGKNGSGKSTLLKLIADSYSLDIGERFQNKSVSIGYLPQDCSLPEYIKTLSSTQEWDDNDQENISISEKNKIARDLGINIEKNIDTLSGGEIKKLLLAKILSEKHDILLLDEPTNHLDIEAIEWLEQFIYSFQGAVVCISHDKTFLRNVSNKICWIHQGHFYKSEDKGFKYFEQWQEEIIKQEESKLKKLNQKLQNEQSWLLGGISARRKRNQKRLKNLYLLREKLILTKEKLAKNKLRIDHDIENDTKVKKIIDISSISFSVLGKNLFQNFSMRIIKGEKIGVIGPNGSGKSSFLQIIQKKLKPTKGYVKHGTDINISYFDQQKSNLDLDKTIAYNLSPGGSEHVLVNNKHVHIRSYIKHFMFDPKTLYEKITTFSGGELTRLSLAKTFINPGNVLILDEPTNDLDLDSLEILLEMLAEYTGTVILVSHNRDFLEQLVTKTLVFANGTIKEYIGFCKSYYYSKDHLKISGTRHSGEKTTLNKNINNKLSYKHQRLLSILPEEINILEQEILQIEKEINEGNLFQVDQKKFFSLSKDLAIKNELINQKFQEWEKIENLLVSHKK